MHSTTCVNQPASANSLSFIHESEIIREPTATTNNSFVTRTHLGFLEMMSSSASKFGYQRLRHEGGGGGGDGDDDDDGRDQRVVMKSRKWFRFRRVHIRRRFRLRFSIWRKKVRLVSAVRLSWAKVLKRLKESQAHFGDLFAGNYLFLQVNPTSLKCNENLQALPSNYSLPRVV